MTTTITDSNLELIHALIDSVSTEQAFMLNDLFLQEVYQKFKEEELIPLLEADASNNQSCPHCGCTSIYKHGKDAFGCQRYRCLNEDCKRKTFSSKTNTLLYYSKCTGGQWLTFMKCLFNKDSVKLTSFKVGVCENTVLCWRHKVMYLLNQLINEEVLEGTIHLDETLFPVTQKGVEVEEQIPKKRGISEQKINVACAIDEKGRLVTVTSETGRITSKSLIEIYQDKIKKGSKVISDSLRSYHKFMKEIEVEWHKIPSGKSSYKGESLERINQIHSAIKTFMIPYRGVSANHLQGYIALYQILRKYSKHHLTKVFTAIVKKIVVMPTLLQWCDINAEDWIYEWNA